MSNLFSGDPGSTSMMRVCMFICILVASGIAIAAFLLGRDLSSAAILAGTFLVPAFGGKAAQNFSEQKALPPAQEIKQ